MLCQNCNKNNASVQINKTINGISTTVHLCATCYKKNYSKAQSAKSFYADLFSSDQKPFNDLRCDACGTTFEDYQREGVLGCACCYDVFKQRLMPIIARIHGKTTHVGKVITNHAEHDLRRTLESLQEQLENAVRAKDFVLAGKINRSIEKIKLQLNGGGI